MFNKIVAVLSFVIFASMAQANSTHFVAPLGSEKWSTYNSRLMCRLSHTVNHYGDASFTQKNAGTHYFQLQSREHLAKETTVSIYSIPPAWKATHKAKLVTQSKLEGGERRIRLSETHTQQLLDNLQADGTLHLYVANG